MMSKELVVQQILAYLNGEVSEHDLVLWAEMASWRCPNPKQKSLTRHSSSICSAIWGQAIRRIFR